LFFQSKRAAVLVKCGIEKADELTFEQPEEIAHFRKSKTGRRRRYTEIEPGAFAPKKVVPRVKLCSRLSFAKDGIFYLQKNYFR